MIKLIIFDWDDVFILGSKNGYFKCYHETLLELGIILNPDLEKERVMENWGKSHREEIKGLLKEWPELWEKAYGIYEQKLFGTAFVDEIKPVKGISDLLQRLSKKYILTVVTGMHPKLLKEMIMPKFEIPNVFSQIITAYDVKDPAKQKPDPYAIEMLLDKFKINADETIMVGDSESDIRMARSAGVIPVAVLTGHLKLADARNLKLTHIIKDVTCLEEVFEALN